MYSVVAKQNEGIELLLLLLCLQRDLFPSDFPLNISYAFPIFTMRAKCPALVNLLDLITLIKSG